MPNSIKYNTESEANALGIGNMHIGTGDVPKGPTSSTGFYNGINPPNGGYTIYLNKATQGPSIFTPSSDAELISVTNGIAGASYTTINECFNYFAGQDDKIVMHNPINYLVTDDLAFYVNAGVIPSYPHNNNTWYDLSGNDNNGTLGSGIGFNSKGWVNFNGTQTSNYNIAVPIDRAELGNNMSVEATFKYEGAAGDSYRPIIGGNDPGAGTEIFFGKNSGNTNFGVQDGNYAGSFVTNYNVFDGEWHHMVYTYDNGTGKIYLDGALRNSGAFTKANNAEQIYIGAEVQEGYWWDGDISQVKYYTKTLSSPEILQNYYQAPIVTDGLVLAVDAGNLVSYESGSTTAYSLTGSLSGSLINGVSFNGNSGGIWEFDGVDDYIAINNLGLSSHTIEGWFNSDDGSQGGASYATICSIFGNYDGGSSKYTYIGLIPNLTFRIDNGATSHADIATVSYTANTWYHVALTYDATSGVAKAYVNGDEVGSRNSTTNITFNSIPHNIAKTQVNVYFDGEVASHKTYDRALTAEEVMQNYNANINKFN